MQWLCYHDHRIQETLRTLEALEAHEQAVPLQYQGKSVIPPAGIETPARTLDG